MKRVLVLTETDALERLHAIPLREFDLVVLAFWASPEFADYLGEQGARRCLRLNEVVTDYGALLAQAFECAHTLAERMPVYRSVNLWRAWENVIANALLPAQVAKVLHEAIAARVAVEAEICFLAPGDMERAFVLLNEVGTPRFGMRILHAEEAGGEGRATRRFGAWWALVGEARHDGDWQNLFSVPVEVLDANYRWRTQLRLPAAVARGGTLCYSSYVNYTRVLGKYAQLSDGGTQWVVNSHSARRGLPRGVTSRNLWAFGRVAWGEHGAVLAEQRAALEASLAWFQGLPLRVLLASNSVVRETAERVVPRLLAEVDLMSALLDEMQPRAVWVANQWGGEGCVLQAAQARGIAVTQVQHGVLEPYFGCAPMYADTFLVWSEFWRNVIPETWRARVQVDPSGVGNVVVGHSAAMSDKRITFFTTPPDITPFWNPGVAVWEVMTLLARLAKDGYAVTLRAHPMDRIARYQALDTQSGQVAWDKGTPLAERIAQTDGAVMMFSTTVLECVANGIPVTGLGWYDFVWKRAVQAAGYIQYEDSLGAVEQRVRAQVG